MTSIGVFGKIPSYPEFISVAARSKTGRSFERWAQMANDQVARVGGDLPMGPIGFVFRDEEAASLLVGVLVRSRDKVGRNFPLSVFCEFGTSDRTSVSHLVESFRPTLTQLSMLALTAVETDRDSLKDAVGRMDRPGASVIKAGIEASEEALRTVRLQQVMERVCSTKNASAYAINVLTRACEQSRRDGAARPTAIDVAVTSDVELAFWLASVESQLPRKHGPLSAFWNVSEQRALVIPGVPDSKVLVSLESRHAQNPRLWRTETSSESSLESAWDKLDDDVRDKLEKPDTCSISEFVAALRASVADS